MLYHNSPSRFTLNSGWTQVDLRCALLGTQSWAACVCLMETGFLSFMEWCEEIHKTFPVLQNRQKSSWWMRLTAGPVGHGSLLPVSPHKTVPDLIKPLKLTLGDKLGPKRPLWDRVDYFGTCFLIWCHWHGWSNTDQLVTKQEFIKVLSYLLSPVASVWPQRSHMSGRPRL